VRHFGVKKMNKKIFHGPILESILLNLINESTDYGLYGYALVKLIQKRFGVHLGSSTIYPELSRLEQHGLTSSNWELTSERPQKKYHITLKGQTLLRLYSLELKALIPVVGTWKKPISD
jgi:DNA-binding PadR family transcriptional regulator